MFKKAIALILFFILITVSSAFAGVLVNYPKFQAYDSDGYPLVGGKLFTYIPGTTTEKATYTDVDLTAANLNPIILNARGEAVVYGSGSYKFVLKDADDSLIWTFDDWQGIQSIGSNCYFPDASQPDQGAAIGGNTVKDFVDSIGLLEQATICFQRGSTGNVTNYTFLASETIPANIHLIIDHGVRLNLDGVGVVLTINGPFEHGLSQCFSGNGSVAGLEVARPEWFGLDGINDDLAWSKAIDALNSGGSLIHGGDYVFSGDVFCLDKSISIKSNRRSSITVNGTYGIYFSGAFTEITTLAVDASAGDKDIDLTDASALSVGDWIDITSGKKFTFNGDQDQGEVRQISAIAGNTISISNYDGVGLWDSYQVVDSAKILKLDLIENPYVENIDFIGPDPNSGLGLLFELTNNAISYNNSHTTIGIGVSLITAQNTKINDSFTECGYGIAIENATQFTHINGNNFNQKYNATSAHSITHGGTGTKGPARFTFITDNIFQHSRTVAVDAHKGSVDKVYLNNNKFISCAYGVFLRSGDMYIYNNEFWINQAGDAMSLTQDMPNATIEIVGNKIYQAKTSLSLCINNFGTIRTLKIADNISIHDYDMSYYIYSVLIGNTIDILKFSGNHIYQSDGRSFYLQNDNSNVHKLIFENNSIDVSVRQFAHIKGCSIVNHINNSYGTVTGVVAADGGVDITKWDQLFSSHNTMESSNGHGLRLRHIAGSTSGGSVHDKYLLGCTDYALAMEGEIDGMEVSHNIIPQVNSIVRDIAPGTTVCYFRGNVVPAGSMQLSSYDVTEQVLQNSAAWDPGNIAVGAMEGKDVALVGARLGDVVIASFSLDIVDLTLTATVTAADTVTCVLANNTAGAVNLANGTIKVRILGK